MDPPRPNFSKSAKKKKKPYKKNVRRADDYHDPLDGLDAGRPHRARDYYDSEDDSTFSEVNLSDAECPVIHGSPEDSEDEESIVKRLYKGPRKCRCCVNWVKQPPQNAIEAKQKDTSKHAVTARYSTRKQDTHVTTSVHSVAVHSQHVKDVLNKVLSGYPSINIGRGDANFYPPFQPLVHVSKELEHSTSELEGEAREHCNAFREVIEPEIRETIDDRDDLVSRGLITYKLLWTLYKPGARAFCKIDGTLHLMQISSTVEEHNSFAIHLSYWDISLKIPSIKLWSEYVYNFAATKPIDQLEVIPFDLFPEADTVVEKLRQRGRKIKDIPQGGLKWFKGFVLVPTQSFGGTRRQWVEGRIIVDPEEYDKMNAQPPMFVDPLLPALPHASTVASSGEEGDVTQEQLMQSRSLVRGFSLATKSWHEFEVDGISDIEWNDKAFDQLVMQPSRKRLIKALVDSNQGRNAGFDDFIKGKGKGVIMLLSGRPGTGKTLTASSIAERIHLPLYSVHSSELSADQAAGNDIETKLGEILHRAAHWNAVLLIDEADAFLEARSASELPSSIARNQRVAVFLRLLEFYSGVLILTTNRKVAFDPAFYSRIHLTLKFDDLDQSARSSVWKNLLRSTDNNVHDNDISTLAEANLNGRQIKNAVQLASLLARSEGETLCLEHLETMMSAVDEIEDEESSEESSGSDD